MALDCATEVPDQTVNCADPNLTALTVWSGSALFTLL